MATASQNQVGAADAQPQPLDGASGLTAATPSHLPAAQVPDMQFVPSGWAGSEHAPVPGSQLPTWWHSSLAAHATGLPPVQTPAWQMSTRVHRSLSSQAVPSI